MTQPQAQRQQKENCELVIHCQHKSNGTKVWTKNRNVMASVALRYVLWVSTVPSQQEVEGPVSHFSNGFRVFLGFPFSSLHPQHACSGKWWQCIVLTVPIGILHTLMMNMNDFLIIYVNHFFPFFLKVDWFSVRDCVSDWLGIVSHSLLQQTGTSLRRSISCLVIP